MSKGKSGGGSGGSTTVTSDPWSGQQPYLKEMFSEAQRLYQNGGLAPEYYSGQTVADQDPYTQAAIQGQAERAMAGSEAVNSANALASQTMQGDYLNQNQFINPQGNPYLADMVQRAQSQSLNNVNGNFAQAGRYGSGAHAAAAQDAAGNIATQMYGQAYDSDQNRALQAYTSERNAQMQAAGLAPALANQDYADLAALSEAGTANENYAQNLINADMNKYNYNAARDLNALQQYAGLIQGNYGGTTTTTGQQGRSNPLGGLLGGASTGAGIGSMIGGPVGTGIGAGLGGLLGMFS